MSDAEIVALLRREIEQEVRRAESELCYARSQQVGFQGRDGGYYAHAKHNWTQRLCMLLRLSRIAKGVHP